MNKHVKNQGRFMSKLLRHDPEDLKMDDQGYVHVEDLLSKLKLTKEELDWIVEENNKKRFAYNEDESLIRANQGHSIEGITIEMDEYIPTAIVFHGTSSKYIDSINKEGLKKMSRLHVHLSEDIETAKNVGSRHSKGASLQLIVLKVDAVAMYEAGHKFYKSKNGVILTDNVPPQYLKESFRRS